MKHYRVRTDYGIAAASIRYRVHSTIEHRGRLLTRYIENIVQARRYLDDTYCWNHKWLEKTGWPKERGGSCSSLIPGITNEITHPGI